MEDENKNHSIVMAQNEQTFNAATLSENKKLNSLQRI